MAFHKIAYAGHSERLGRRPMTKAVGTDLVGLSKILDNTLGSTVYQVQQISTSEH